MGAARRRRISKVGLGARRDRDEEFAALDRAGRERR
jgi:hypothetical protein